VTRFVEYRTGSDFEANSQFIGNDVRKCGLSQPRRAVKKHVIERLTTHTGRTDNDLQIFCDLLLSTESTKGKRTQSIFIFTFAVLQVVVAVYVECFFHHLLRQK